MPGTSGYEWTGFVPTPELPHTFNPAAGYVATANHKMIPDNYAYNVGFEWDRRLSLQPYRRVLCQLRNRADHKLDLTDMQGLQNDVHVAARSRLSEIAAHHTAAR